MLQTIPDPIDHSVSILDREFLKRTPAVPVLQFLCEHHFREIHHPGIDRPTPPIRNFLLMIKPQLSDQVIQTVNADIVDQGVGAPDMKNPLVMKVANQCFALHCCASAAYGFLRRSASVADST